MTHYHADSSSPSKPLFRSLGVVSTIVNKDIDWLWIDCEHGWASPVEGTGAACVLARSRGVAPVIRVAWNDPALIKKALDMGAVGVMIPQVQNAAEAKAAVDAARYFPEGMRGISPVSAAPRFAIRELCWYRFTS